MSQRTGFLSVFCLVLASVAVSMRIGGESLVDNPLVTYYGYVNFLTKAYEYATIQTAVGAGDMYYIWLAYGEDAEGEDRTQSLRSRAMMNDRRLTAGRRRTKRISQHGVPPSAPSHHSLPPIPTPEMVAVNISSKTVSWRLPLKAHGISSQSAMASPGVFSLFNGSVFEVYSERQSHSDGSDGNDRLVDASSSSLPTKLWSLSPWTEKGYAAPDWYYVYYGGKAWMISIPNNTLWMVDPVAGTADIVPLTTSSSQEGKEVEQVDEEGAGRIGDDRLKSSDIKTESVLFYFSSESSAVDPTQIIKKIFLNNGSVGIQLYDLSPDTKGVKLRWETKYYWPADAELYNFDLSFVYIQLRYPAAGLVVFPYTFGGSLPSLSNSDSFHGWFPDIYLSPSSPCAFDNASKQLSFLYENPLGAATMMLCNNGTGKPLFSEEVTTSTFPPTWFSLEGTDIGSRGGNDKAIVIAGTNMSLWSWPGAQKVYSVPYTTFYEIPFTTVLGLDHGMANRTASQEGNEKTVVRKEPSVLSVGLVLVDPEDMYSDLQFVSNLVYPKSGNLIENTFKNTDPFTSFQKFYVNNMANGRGRVVTAVNGTVEIWNWQN